MGNLGETNHLSVGIVGAGIAGLGAAIALRNAGHDIELFEQSQFKYEVGAAITLPPNGVIALKRLGVDPALAKPVISTYYELVAGETLETLASFPMTETKEQYGNYMLLFSRTDLHGLLRRSALEPDQGGMVPKINLGCKIKDIDCQNGTIHFNDGRSVQKDLVIVADGIKTKFVPAITGQDISTHKNGRSAFRALIPLSAIRAHPELGPYWEKVKPGFWIPIKGDHSTHVVTYPCGDSGLLNLVLLHYTLPEHAHKEDWTSAATIDDLLAATPGFHPLVHELLKLSNDTKVHTLHARQPLPTLVNGRAVIVGDAAGPHQPHLAQGGTMALEFAAALGLLFAKLRRPSPNDTKSTDISVEERLAMFNDVMRYRLHLAQLMSDCIPYSANDPLKVEARRRLEALTEGRDTLPPNGYPPLGPAVRDLLYGHNVVKSVTDYLGKHGLAVDA